MRKFIELLNRNVEVTTTGPLWSYVLLGTILIGGMAYLALT